MRMCSPTIAMFMTQWAGYFPQGFAVRQQQPDVEYRDKMRRDSSFVLNEILKRIDTINTFFIELLFLF